MTTRRISTSIQLESEQMPQYRKEIITLVLSLNAAVVGAYGPMLGPDLVQIAQQLNGRVARDALGVHRMNASVRRPMSLYHLPAGQDLWQAAHVRLFEPRHAGRERLGRRRDQLSVAVGR